MEILCSQRESLGLPEEDGKKKTKVTNTGSGESKGARLHTSISEKTKELLNRIKGILKTDDYDLILQEMAQVYLAEKTPP